MHWWCFLYARLQSRGLSLSRVFRELCNHLVLYNILYSLLLYTLRCRAYFLDSNCTVKTNTREHESAKDAPTSRWRILSAAQGMRTRSRKNVPQLRQRLRELHGDAARAIVRQHDCLCVGENPLFLHESGNRRGPGWWHRLQAAPTVVQRHPRQHRLRHQHRAAAVPLRQRRRVHKVQKHPASDLAQCRVLIYKQILSRQECRAVILGELNDARDGFTKQPLRNEITVPLVVRGKDLFPLAPTFRSFVPFRFIAINTSARQLRAKKISLVNTRKTKSFVSPLTRIRKRIFENRIVRRNILLFFLQY